MRKLLLIILAITNIGFAESSSVSVRKNYAPDVIVKDLEGKDIELKTIVNGKVTVLNFWATWCPSCRQELAEMEKYFQKYKDKGLVVIAFSVDQNINDVIKYNKEKNLTIKMLMSNEKLISAYGGMKSIPVTFILDYEGQTKNKIIGFDTTRIEKEIKEYLLDIK